MESLLLNRVMCLLFLVEKLIQLLSWDIQCLIHLEGYCISDNSIVSIQWVEKSAELFTCKMCYNKNVYATTVL